MPVHCGRASGAPILPPPPRSNWGNWVAAAGLTGGRVNKFNITKQSNVSAAEELHALKLWTLRGGHAMPCCFCCRGSHSGSIPDPAAPLIHVFPQDYDPQGDYIRTWVPELAGVPARRIHEPWLMGREEQEAAGCRIGQDYPAPLKSAWKGERGMGSACVGGCPTRQAPRRRDRTQLPNATIL